MVVSLPANEGHMDLNPGLRRFYCSPIALASFQERGKISGLVKKDSRCKLKPLTPLLAFTFYNTDLISQRPIHGAIMNVMYER